MRKLAVILGLAFVAMFGLGSTAFASTGPNWSSAPGNYGPHGGTHPCSNTLTCTPDTLSFGTHGNRHDWNNQDPCIVHRHQGFRQNSINTTDIRGCRCQVVKIWHTKWTWDKSKCRWVESWYFTTKSICRDHHRDPRQCGCHIGGQVTPAIRQAA